MSTFKIKISVFVSRLFSPSVVWVSGIIVFSFKEIETYSIALLQSLILSFVSLIIPYMGMRKLKIEIDSVMPTNIIKHQNNPFLLFLIITGLIFSWLISNLFLTEQPILHLYFSIVGSLSIMIFIVRHFSNCSGHVTSITSLSCLFSFVYSSSIIYFLPIIFIVGYSRISLKVHSIMEVIEGFILGSSIVFLFSKYLHL